MLEARRAVTEFCRRSAQTGPAEGEQFLARLSRLPPDDMHDWLQRYQERKANTARAREAERNARQVIVDNAIQRQESTQQAAENAAQLRGQAAPMAEWFLTTPQLQPVRHPPHCDADLFGQTLSYNPLEPVIDPMSPRGYRRRVAAAMSLPGDLQRSDPRNYIRGEEGIDFGEWATFREAVPPVPPVPPIAPANAPATEP